MNKLYASPAEAVADVFGGAVIMIGGFGPVGSPEATGIKPVAARNEQLSWNAAYATELCRRACNRLFEGAGAGAAHDSHAMQVFFRDMNTASHHPMLDFDVNVEIQGKVLLGVELNDAWV